MHADASPAPPANLRPIVSLGLFLAIGNLLYVIRSHTTVQQISLSEVTCGVLTLAAASGLIRSAPRQVRRAALFILLGAWVILLARLITWLPFATGWMYLASANVIGVASLTLAAALITRTLRLNGALLAASRWRWATLLMAILHVFPAIGLLALGGAGMRENIRLSGNFVGLAACAAWASPALALFWATLGTYRVAYAKRKDTCVNCGYPLGANLEAPCTECGSTLGRPGDPTHSAWPSRPVLAVTALLIAAAFMLGELTWRQRPESRYLERIPTPWLLRYAETLLPDGQRNPQDAMAMTLNRSGRPTRSYSTAATLSQKELLRRSDSSIFTPEELNRVADAACDAVIAQVANTTEWSQLLAAATRNGTLSVPHRKRLQEAWLILEIACRDEFEPREPMGLEVRVRERLRPDSFLPGRLPIMFYSHGATMRIATATLGGVELLRDAPLPFGRGSSENALFQPNGGASEIIVPDSVPTGPAELTVQIVFQWNADLSYYRLSRDDLRTAGLPDAQTFTLRKAVLIQPRGNRITPTLNPANAKQEFTSRSRLLLFPQRAELSVWPDMFQEHPPPPCSFIMDVYLPWDHDTSIGTAMLTRTSHNHHTFRLTQEAADRLLNLPEIDRNLLLRPNLKNITRVSDPGPFYNGPEFEVPISQH